MEIIQNDYKQILQRIVAEIKNSRIKVARKITQYTMELYWNIGKELSTQQLEKGYGGQVVRMLSADLQREFPNATGFSPRNLWNMKRFYERYCEESVKVQRCVALLPWSHNLLLMSNCKDADEVYFYATRSMELGWTRDVLLNYIKANAYSTEPESPKLHNFKETLELGEKEYYVDMLFFNRCIRSLIAVDLKIGSFQPEYVGKMNFYLNLLDRQIKMPDENPSIGIILCADRNNMEVEVSLQGTTAPIGVSEYSYLIPQKQIKELIHNELSEADK